jgi:hypothetical protein
LLSSFTLYSECRCLSESQDNKRIRITLKAGLVAGICRGKLVSFLDTFSRLFFGKTRSSEYLLLADLLAVIHRDGGQHLLRHGLEKSCEEAKRQIISLRVQAEVKWQDNSQVSDNRTARRF